MNEDNLCPKVIKGDNYLCEAWISNSREIIISVGRSIQFKGDNY